MKRIKVTILVLMTCFLIGCGSKTKEGVSFLEEQNYEDALAAFKKGVEKDKNPGEAYRGMGIAYFEMENYEKAAESFEKALENETEETGTLYNLLGTSCLKMESYEDALTYYQKGIEMHDCSEKMLQEMQFNEILVYEKLGDWENAKVKVNAYIEQYPDDEKAAKEAEFLKTR